MRALFLCGFRRPERPHGSRLEWNSGFIAVSDPFYTECDTRVRTLLAERGDDGHVPRHTLFFFYDGDCEALAAAATAAGYEARPSACGPTFSAGVVLETTTAVDDETFERLSEQMQAWAEEFGCTYDGWECQLVNQ